MTPVISDPPSEAPDTSAATAVDGPRIVGTPIVDAPTVAVTDDVEVTWRRAVTIGLVTFVVSRLCVLAGAGVRAAQVYIDSRQENDPVPESPAQLVTGVFTQWDGNWYMAIVRHGYPDNIPPDVTYGMLQARAAFFPLYPLLVRAVDRILPGGDVFAAMSLNVVLSVISVVLVGILARRLFGIEAAQRAMVLFAVFPGSVVLSYTYAEALLITLAALCLLFLLDERWLLAGVTAALATATRPNGLALVASCAVAAFVVIRERREWRSLVAVALAPTGFVAFQLFLGIYTGEPGAWFRVQAEAWDEGTSYGATAVKNTFTFITHPLDSPGAALTVCSLIALGFGLWCMWHRRMPLPIVAYVAVVVILMLLPATVTARPRFVFTAFPLFIAAAAWWPVKRRAEWDLVLLVSGAGLGVLTALYAVFGAIP